MKQATYRAWKCRQGVHRWWGVVPAIACCQDCHVTRLELEYPQPHVVLRPYVSYKRDVPAPEWDDRDEAYERAAARARANDFEDTDGKDWT